MVDQTTPILPTSIETSLLLFRYSDHGIVECCFKSWIATTLLGGKTKKLNTGLILNTWDLGYLITNGFIL